MSHILLPGYPIFVDVFTEEIVVEFVDDFFDKIVDRIVDEFVAKFRRRNLQLRPLREAGPDTGGVRCVCRRGELPLLP